MSALNARLEADTLPIGDNDFVWLRYMNDQRFPWLIVVPKQDNLREWFELEEQDQQRLLRLINALSRALQQQTGADKMNLGAIGNLVPQLHVHIIARQQNDACWPAPVWGNGKAEPFGQNQQPVWLASIRSLFASI